MTGQEGPLRMVFHGVLIGSALYLFLRYVLKHAQQKALTKSVLVGLLAAAYMIVFGHQLPTHINPSLR